jgi:ComEC/Rec2-related protein
MLIPLNIHPLFFLTLSFMLGIVLQAVSPMACWLWLVGSGMILYLAHIFFKQISMPFWRTSLYCISAAGGSWLYLHQLTQYQIAQQHLMEHAGPLTVTIQTIEHIPDLYHAYRVTAAIQPKSSKHTLHGYGVMVYTHTLANLEVGDTITLPPATFKAPTNEACARYYVRQNILAGLFCDTIVYTDHTRPYFHPWRWFDHLRAQLWTEFKNHLSKPTYTLCASLFGGSKDLYQDQIRTIRSHFKKWGLSHYLARSGIHLVMVTWLWIMLLRLIPCKLLIKQILLIFLVLFYALLTWPSVSFMRAFGMALISQTSGLLYKDSLSLHTLSLVTLVMLLINPSHLFFLDFQLSFGCSYALIWLSHLNHQHHRLASTPA